MTHNNFTAIRCSNLVHFSLAVSTLYKHGFFLLLLTISHFRMHTAQATNQGIITVLTSNTAVISTQN